MPTKKKNDSEGADKKESVDSSAEAISEVIEKPFDTSKLDADARRMAKKWGLDVEAMEKWFESVEARFKALADGLEPLVSSAMDKAVAKVAAQAKARQSEIVRSGGSSGGEGFGLGDLMKLASAGEGGGDPVMKQLQTELMRVSIDNMKSGAQQSKAITDAIVRKITGKAIGDTVDDITR